MMLELCLESVFALVDIYFVNKLGVHAVSVVGLTESVITIVYSIGIGLSSAATAIVSRRVGEKQLDKAAAAGVQAIIIGVVVSIVLGIPGLIFSETVLTWMGAEPEAIKSCSSYTKWIFAGNCTVILLFLINGIFRGAGNPAIAMKSLWIGNLFNIILDPLFIFGFAFIPAMGIKGAAIATVTGRSIGVLYQIYHLMNSSGKLKYYREQLIPDFDAIKKILEVAWPAAFQFIIASASWIFLASMVAKYGSSASAGYQTAIRLVVFFILPAWGLSNAVATLVGQNLGAGMVERAEKSVSLTAKINISFMAGVSVLFLFMAKDLVLFFIPENEIAQIEVAVLSLRIISAGYIFYGAGMVVTQAFNGAGDTKTPTWIHFAGFWLFQIPFAYILHHYTQIGVGGVIVAIPVAETLMAITSVIVFRRGKWKTVQV
ncbi:MAG: MATE family efflux transporter [Bacteroidetes bacterium]|nr:MATE family efflux transporter [Bacteroidota bacterium]